MALFPTKKITALAPAVALTGDEQLECVQGGNSRKVTSRQFVLPTDSLITVSSMAGFLPGSRQLVDSATVQIIDNGPGSTLSLNALLTGALPGNPTATIGLTPVNGVAVTWLRSDSAPALSQAIIPAWTGQHSFHRNSTGLFYGLRVYSSNPLMGFVEEDAAANNQLWDLGASGEQFIGRVRSDDGLTNTSWLVVDRTGTTVDTINLLATTVQVNGQNVRDAAILTSGTIDPARLPSSFSGLANPTASVGLAAVNGAATTAMRSDAAPALDQAIAPTWTAQHIFSLSGATNAAIFASSAQPQVDWNETDGAANNRRWRFEAQGEQFLGRTVNDANSAAVTWLAVDRTLNVVDTIALTSTALTWNGNPLLSTATAFANPTGTIGLAAVNGVATTAMRSDAAPALSQAIAPTWTAAHIFSLAGDGSTGTPIDIASSLPQWNLRETDAAANNRVWSFSANGEQLRFRISNDAGNTVTDWLTVDRTGTTVDSVAFPSCTVLFNNAGPGFTVERTANPSFRVNESAAAADNRLWDIAALAETLTFRTVNDAVSVTATWMSVDRTGTTVDRVAFPTTTAASHLIGTSASLLAAVHTHILAPSGSNAVVAKSVTVGAGAYVAWNNLTAGDNVFVEFGTEAAYTARGSISYNRAGGLVAYNTTSDVRRKKNIRDSDEAGDIVDRIRIRAFDWTESDVHVDYWVIAQELHSVMPMAVTKSDDDRGNDWAVDPSKLVPLMIKEIQSMRRRLTVLER